MDQKDVGLLTSHVVRLSKRIDETLNTHIQPLFHGEQPALHFPEARGFVTGWPADAAVSAWYATHTHPDKHTMHPPLHSPHVQNDRQKSVN